MVDLSEVPNPYEFANPVTKRERFAGRHNEIADIRYYLRHARNAENPVSLALIGERASGKTSLLNIIDIEAKSAGLITARINLNSSDSEPINLFWKLYEAIVDAAMAAGYLFRAGTPEELTYRKIIDLLDATADHPNFPLRFPAHYALAVNGGRNIAENKLQRDLAYIFGQSERPMVLLFDECNVLSSNRITLEMLRNVFMNMPGYLLVLTGTQTFFPVLDDVFSPIIRQFKKIHITPFKDRQDTTACILNPLGTLPVNVNHLMADRRRLTYEIHALSGGRPYEIQLLCHIMFRRIQEDRAERMAITADVIDDVLRELDTSVNRDSTTHPLSYKMRTLTSAQLTCLGIIGEHGGGANSEETWFNYQFGERFRTSPRNMADRQTFDECKSQLVQLGLVKVSESGLMSFAGSDFDTIYARYLGESKGIRIHLDGLPYSWGLARNIRRVIDSIDLGSRAIAQSGIRESDLAEYVKAILSNTSTSIPESAADAYESIAEALDTGRLVLVRLLLTYRTRRATHWLSYPGRTYDPAQARSAFTEAIEYASELGGEFTLEEYTFDLPSTEVLLDKILSSTTNHELLDLLGESHSKLAISAYNRGDYATALNQAQSATRFPLKDPSTLNNLAYIKFTSGHLEEAVRLINQGLDICLSGEKEATFDNLHLAALLIYNRATVDMSCGRVTAARSRLAVASKGISESRSRTYDLKCLFLPVVCSGGLILEERIDLELASAIDEALATLADTPEPLGPVAIHRALRP